MNAAVIMNVAVIMNAIVDVKLNHNSRQVFINFTENKAPLRNVEEFYLLWFINILI